MGFKGEHLAPTEFIRMVLKRAPGQTSSITSDIPLQALHDPI
jgi:hypothetical protein